MIRKAAIDFGTNTFHLFIADQGSNDSFTEVYRKRTFVFLDRSKGSSIDQQAWKDALEAIGRLKHQLDRWQVDEVKAVCTEVFRKKDNGEQLRVELSDILGHEIKLISGDDEAKLISAGVRHSLQEHIPQYLIMDIGGGSTEFIMIQDSHDIWRKSLKTGLSVLTQTVDFTGRLSTQQLDDLQLFLTQQLIEIQQLINKNGIDTLIVNAGSAELLPGVLKGRPFGLGCVGLNIADFEDIYNELIFTDMEQREKVDWIPSKRNFLMPMFLFKVKFILNYLKMKKLIYSPASLREGLILDK